MFMYTLFSHVCLKVFRITIKKLFSLKILHVSNEEMILCLGEKTEMSVNICSHFLIFYCCWQVFFYFNVSRWDHEGLQSLCVWMQALRTYTSSNQSIFMQNAQNFSQINFGNCGENSYSREISKINVHKFSYFAYIFIFSSFQWRLTIIPIEIETEINSTCFRPELKVPKLDSN